MPKLCGEKIVSRSQSRYDASFCNDCSFIQSCTRACHLKGRVKLLPELSSDLRPQLHMQITVLLAYTRHLPLFQHNTSLSLLA